MKRNNVLIVDDQHWVKTMLKEALSYSGFDAHVASDHVEAIEIVIVEQPEIVIIDVNLPEIDGFRLLSIIRSIKPDVKAVFISGSSNVNVARRAMAEGALRYFIKPFDVFDFTSYLTEISQLDTA